MISLSTKTVANPDVVEVINGLKRKDGSFIDERLIKGTLYLGAKIKKNKFGLFGDVPPPVPKTQSKLGAAKDDAQLLARLYT